jgi:hypothetical protein
VIIGPLAAVFVYPQEGGAWARCMVSVHKQETSVGQKTSVIDGGCTHVYMYIVPQRRLAACMCLAMRVDVLATSKIRDARRLGHVVSNCYPGIAP